MLSRQNEISKQCNNMEQEEAKVNIEETTVNLSCVKKELDECDFDFDENRYKLTLTFDNIFGESSKEQRDNKASLIGFLDDEVVMEMGTIKLEGVKDEEDLLREIMEQSDCNKCGGNYEGYCLDCSSLSHILNNFTPSINPEPILNTVPINMLEIREVSQRKAVFALKTLPKSLILGPFEGVAPIESTTGSQWKIKDKKLVLDQNANWMQYIEIATNHALKNLDVFQFDGILYFETTRDIQEGEELLVCYREEKVVNTDDEEESYLIPVKKEKYPRVYACTLCCLGFRLETCLMEHKNKCPQGDHGGFSEDFEIIQCRCCKVWLEKQEHLERHMLYCLESYNRLRRNFPHFQPFEVVDVGEIRGKYEISSPIDGNACDSTKCEIIQSKRSWGISEKTVVKKLYEEHMVTIHSSTNEKKYKCSECPYQTNQNSHFRRHLNTHNGVKLFECDICKKKFTEKGSLKRHTKSQHPNTNEKYKCSECSYETNYKEDLKRHIQHSNASKKEHKCSECTYETNYKRNLSRHSIIHSGIKPFECNVCKKKFTEKYRLKMHIKDQHTGINEKRYKCSECSFRTNYKNNLKNHFNAHSGIKHQCDVCKKKFTAKSNLIRHTKDLHSNSRKKGYKCSLCSFQTISKKYLMSHSINHSGVMPFECVICKKKFRRKGDMKRHIKNMHTKEKRYKCPDCSFQTNRKNHLKDHLYAHHGIKLFRCNVCDKEFNFKSNLNRHMKMQHSNIKEEK